VVDAGGGAEIPYGGGLVTEGGAGVGIVVVVGGMTLVGGAGVGTDGIVVVVDGGAVAG